MAPKAKEKDKKAKAGDKKPADKKAPAKDAKDKDKKAPTSPKSTPKSTPKNSPRGDDKKSAADKKKEIASKVSKEKGVKVVPTRTAAGAKEEGKVRRGGLMSVALLILDALTICINTLTFEKH
jgi:hypothetical protein